MLLLRGIRTACPVNFGLLRNSLTSQQVAPGLWKVGIFQEAAGEIEAKRRKLSATIMAQTGTEPGTVFHYAQIVHSGRGPVRAKRAKCLHFMVPSINAMTGRLRLVQSSRGRRSRFADVFVKSVGPAPAHPFIPWGMMMAKLQITGYLSTQAGSLDKA
jgi:hypothetical protein